MEDVVEKPVDSEEKENIEERDNSKQGKEMYFFSPYIKEMPYKLKQHGSYSTEDGKPKMIVIHYTVSPTWEKTPDEQAAGILSYFERQGFGTLVMATDGQIYRGKDYDLEKKSWHSGKSFWKTAPGSRNIHHYGIGVEVCCAGKVGKRRDGFYPAWHYEDWRIDGKLKKGKQPVQMRVREFEGAPGQKAGHYEQFTKEQEKSLINFCVWACIHWDIDPENIVGHDEIDLRGWKSDPGGSLSMTMKQFRDHIRKLLVRLDLN